MSRIVLKHNTLINCNSKIVAIAHLLMLICNKSYIFHLLKCLFTHGYCQVNQQAFDFDEHIHHWDGVLKSYWVLLIVYIWHVITVHTNYSPLKFRWKVSCTISGFGNMEISLLLAFVSEKCFETVVELINMCEKRSCNFLYTFGSWEVYKVPQLYSQFKQCLL
jgi:hypothetical protein